MNTAQKEQPLHPLLAQLGLTPEIIARYVVSVSWPLTKQEMREIYGHRQWRVRRQAEFLKQGLTVEGKPRRRSPNGIRKPKS